MFVGNNPIVWLDSYGLADNGQFPDPNLDPFLLPLPDIPIQCLDSGIVTPPPEPCPDTIMLGPCPPKDEHPPLLSLPDDLPPFKLEKPEDPPWGRIGKLIDRIAQPPKWHFGPFEPSMAIHIGPVAGIPPGASQPLTGTPAGGGASIIIRFPTPYK
jgi:hypothetical protein